MNTDSKDTYTPLYIIQYSETVFKQFGIVYLKYVGRNNANRFINRQLGNDNKYIFNQP